MKATSKMEKAHLKGSMQDQDYQGQIGSYWI
jgi:hypothetical protein